MDQSRGDLSQSDVCANQAAKEREKAAYREWWRDAVNLRGALFRIEEEVIPGPYGEPHCPIRLIEDPRTGIDFLNIAMHLYRHSFGGILCRDRWGTVQGDNLDCLWLSYGEIVDYLIFSRRLVEYTTPVPGWRTPVDLRGIRLEAPGFDILTPLQRMTLTRAMKYLGIGDPRVVLCTDRLGNRCLMFNIHRYILEQETVMAIGNAINWCLPRFYAQALFKNDYEIAIHPILPFEATDEEAMYRIVLDAESDELRKRVKTTAEAAKERRREPAAIRTHWLAMALDPGERF